MHRPRASHPAGCPRRTTWPGTGLAAALCLAWPIAAHAQQAPARDAAPPAAGQEALERARAAWDKGDYDVAEPLFAEAIDTGGLAMRDTLDAYVHLGAARAVLGKKAAALAAFKSAAVLDLRFAVPTEAGKKAMSLADQARRLQANLGTLAFHVDVPDPVPPGGPAVVAITLDPAHAALSGSRFALDARDPTRGGSHVDSVRATKAAHFDLPATLLLPSATLRVRVDWVDAHENRLASSEEQVHVQPQAHSDLLASSPLDGHPGGGAGHASDADGGKHRGFWHSVWPYVIGSAALAAGAVAVYFATRPGDDVNVTGVRVVTY